LAGKIEPRYHKRKKAIEEALEILGPHASSIVITFLSSERKIIIDSNYCSPIEEIGTSLRELLGNGASLIIDSIAIKELRSGI
jgi:hypothetical protein